MRKRFIIAILLCTSFLLMSCAPEDPMFLEARQYASRMQFHTSVGALEDRGLETLKGRGYTHVRFVHSEEEFLTGDFPDNAVIAWPSLRTHLMLDRINFWIREDEDRFDLELHSLTYPLTTYDLIYNWHNVGEIRSRLGRHVNDVGWYALFEHERIIMPELFILVEAFEAAGIDVAEHGLELPLYSQNATEIFWNIFRARLYDKLDEDVQLQLMHEIPIFLAEYSNELRFVEWAQAGQ